MEKTRIQSFTDLQAWQQAHKLRIGVLQEVSSFPSEHKYGLSSQLQRASISIGSNIVEGFGRRTKKEKIQFYGIARGSLTEVQDQLILSHDMMLIEKGKFKELAEQSVRVHKLINRLMRSIKESENV